MPARRFGLLGAVATLLIVLLAGGIGFALGVATNGAPGVHYGYWPAWGWGFGFFGFLFPVLFFLLIFLAIRGWSRGWDGPDGGRWSRGYYGRAWHGDVPPAVEEWHCRLHGENGAASTGPGTGSTGSGQTAPGSGNAESTRY